MIDMLLLIQALFPYVGWNELVEAANCGGRYLNQFLYRKAKTLSLEERVNVLHDQDFDDPGQYGGKRMDEISTALGRQKFLPPSINRFAWIWARSTEAICRTRTAQLPNRTR